MIFDCRHEKGIGDLKLVETGDAVELKCNGRTAVDDPDTLSETCRRCKYCNLFSGHRRTVMIRK